MKYNISDFKKMKFEELIFIFSMMRKYGGMPDPVILDDEIKPRKPNPRKQKQAKKPTQNNEFPSLTDFGDPKWESCTDEKFLTFRAIMLSVQRA